MRMVTVNNVTLTEAQVVEAAVAKLARLKREDRTKPFVSKGDYINIPVDLVRQALRNFDNARTGYGGYITLDSDGVVHFNREDVPFDAPYTGQRITG